MKISSFILALALSSTTCAATPAQYPHAPMFLGPEAYRCFDILRLEALPINPETGIIQDDLSSDQLWLVLNYMQVTGWLRGYFTGKNEFDERADEDITKDTREKEWMPWIYSYCRSHPADSLLQAAIELTKAIARLH